VLRLLGGKDEGYDESVETKGLREDEDENHADEDPLVLSDSAHTSVTDDANGHAGGKTGEAHRETGSQVSETLEAGVIRHSHWREGRAFKELNEQKMSNAPPPLTLASLNQSLRWWALCVPLVARMTAIIRP